MIDSDLLQHLGGYWNGRFHHPDSSERFAVRNPASGEVLAELPMLGAEHTHQAVASAGLRLAEPPTFERRIDVLRRIAESLHSHREELGRIITLENGKPLVEAVGEVVYAAGFFSDAAERVSELRPHTLDARPKGLEWRVHHRPAGIAGLITPWNFPLGMLAKKLAGALAAGCPSVIKPSEKTPLSCIAFFSLLHELGLEPGTCNLVFGDAPRIGEVLCEDPQVRVISFTGSTGVGKLLAAQCAPHIKRVALELGGNAPFVVFEDADLERAAEELLSNKFRCAGQTCVCTNRVLVAQRVQDAFVAAVASRVAALRWGPGLQADNHVGPLIDGEGFDKVQRLVSDALEKGARAVVGGIAPTANRPFFPPTVLVGVTREMACFTEEIFGPVVSIATFTDESAAIEAANDTEYGLAAYIFTADSSRAERCAARLHFGHVGINTATGPTPEAPFGGMHHSGLGREGGLEGLLEFTEIQTTPVGSFEKRA